MSTVHLNLSQNLINLIDKKRAKYGVPRTTYITRLIMDDVDDMPILESDGDDYDYDMISNESFSNAENMMDAVLNNKITYEKGRTFKKVSEKVKETSSK